jgi:hypothetical protein
LWRDSRATSSGKQFPFATKGSEPRLSRMYPSELAYRRHKARCLPKVVCFGYPSVSYVKFSLTPCEVLHLLGKRPWRIVGSVASAPTVGIAIMNELNGASNRLPKILRDIRFTFAALAAGSRVVSMADNREVITGLAARAASIYGRFPQQILGQLSRPDSKLPSQK